jgi:hypothetical protein
MKSAYAWGKHCWGHSAFYSVKTFQLIILFNRLRDSSDCIRGTTEGAFIVCKLNNFKYANNVNMPYWIFFNTVHQVPTSVTVNFLLLLAWWKT